MVTSILVDDADLQDIIYSGVGWTHEAQQKSTLNGTLTTLNTKTQNTTLAPLSFSMYFFGTDINIYGSGSKGISLNYSLDNAAIQPGVINSDGGTGKNGVNIWTLQGLDPTALHTIKIVPSGGPFTLDYITYTPKQSTTTTYQSLIVDDADQSIQYTGMWNKTTGDFPIGVPYLGTMTGTNNQGSKATFTFVGSSVSVYGLLNQQAGKLSALFSVDGGTTTAYTPFSGTQATNASAWTLSQQFYHQDLQAGSHTLTVQLEEVTGDQVLWIDSVAYTGTIDTQVNNGKSGGSGLTLSPGVIAAIAVIIACICALGGFTQRRRIVGYITTTRITTTTTSVLYR